MNQSEGWGMYREIHQLKQIGLNISQIARRLNINRNTVAKYLSMTTEEFKNYLESIEARSKKLGKVHDEILSWIRENPAEVVIERLGNFLLRLYIGNKNVEYLILSIYSLERRQANEVGYSDEVCY